MEIRTVLKTDLTKPVKVQNLNGNFFSQDNQANAIYVEVTDNGEPVTLSGGITGYVVRGDGYTVVINGTIEDGKAKVVLNEGCYRVTGAISVVVKAGTTTIGACHGYVYRSSTDSIVDPEHLIPSLNDLLAQIDNCRQATTAANSAAQSANQATTDANSAAQSANGAATAIQGLTTSAQTGTTPGAVPSDVDGHKHIAFTFPVIIPNLDFAVTTLPPESNVTVEVDKSSPHSIENPLVTLGIPRGATGTITNASGMSIPISESDSTKIKTYIDSADQTLDGRIDDLEGHEGFVIYIPISASGTQTATNSLITANHYLTGVTFVNSQGNITSDVLAELQWTTSDGSLEVIVGTVYATGTAILDFGWRQRISGPQASGGGT